MNSHLLRTFCILTFTFGFITSSYAATVDFDSFADMTSINDLNPLIIGEFEAIDPENSAVRFDDSLVGEMSLRIAGFSAEPDALYRLPTPASEALLIFTDNANGGLDVTASFYTESLTLAEIGLYTPVAVFSDIEPVNFLYQGAPILTIAFDTMSSDIQLNEITFSPVPIPAAVWLFGSGLIGLVGVARRRKAA